MLRKKNGNPFGPASWGLKNYYIDQKGASLDWSEDIVYSKAKTQSSAPSVPTDYLNSKKIRIWLLVLLFGLGFLFLRLVYLQIFENQQYKVVAEGNRVRVRDIKAVRGVIYDRNRNLLVKNIPSFSLAVVPVDLPKEKEKRQEIIKQLSFFSGKTEDEISQLILSSPAYSYQPVIIQENLNQDQAFLTKIESYSYPGVVLLTNSVRQYLDTGNIKSLSHLFGYVGKLNQKELDSYLDNGYAFDDYIGKAGIELSEESVLKGKNGSEYVEVDALGKTKKNLAYQKPEMGKNLVLTIDKELQNQVEISLKRVLAAHAKKKGAAIVLNPNNGEILAMVSLPAFDNNLFSLGGKSEDFLKLLEDPNQPLFSRAISGEYPSGSTFKLVMAAAALQEGIINIRTSFNSVGGIAVSRWFFPDWKAGGHGWTNVIKALAESVNTFFYIIGGGYNDFSGLGIEKIKKYAELFGLNKTLGIELPAEADGFLPSPEWKEENKKEQWYIGDTYHLSIGQGDLLATPLQVACWTGFFASNGNLYQPHVVKEIFDSSSVQATEPKVLRSNFIDSENIKIVNQGLRQAVLSGSARSLADLPISVAAKTGTAEWSTKNLPHAWITAFAPYDKPEIVVTVLVEEGGEGSSVALPVAKDILYWWATNRKSAGVDK